MGTLTGTNLAARARDILHDTTSGGVRWLDAELLNNINDAQRMIVLLKPNSNPVTSGETMVAGSKQTIPTGGIQLLDVIRNVSGNAIRRVDRDILDSENPGWHEATASNTAEHFIFSEDQPDVFYLYPQQTATPGNVEIVYSAAPTDLGSLASTIALNDIYANVIIDFLLYRCYLKDTEYAGNQQRAQQHYVAFNEALGIKVQAELSFSPNQNPPPIRVG